MKDNVLKESYVERFAREQKEKGIPARAEGAERGIPSKGGIPETEGIPKKEVKKHGTNTRSEGQTTQKD